MAKGGAFEIQLDTAGQTFDVFFEQTGAGTSLAGGDAFATGFDAFLVLLCVLHNRLFYRTAIKKYTPPDNFRDLLLYRG